MIRSVHLNYVLGTLPLAERFKAARELGFTAVELPFPYDLLPAAGYSRLLGDNGLVQVSIGAPTSNYRTGEPGYAVCAGLSDAFDDSITRAIGYAREIRCPYIHVFSGAKPAETSFEEAWKTYIANLARAHDRAAAHGIHLIIEPINSIDFPRYFLDRLSMALSAIAESRRPGIKIILDLYHAHVMGEDPVAFIREHCDAIGHVQFADYPGRHEPGSGTINFDAAFSAIHQAGYRGSIGLEYIPTRPIQEDIPLKRQLGLT